jgi:hypothetical protein
VTGRGARGAALLAVLLALSLTSALVVGGAYVTRQFATASGLANRGALLEPLVEEAIVRAVVGWDTASRNAQPPGVIVELARVTASGIEVTTSVVRLRDDLWWIVADATSTAKPLLRRRLGLLTQASGDGVRPLSQRAWADLP